MVPLLLLLSVTSPPKTSVKLYRAGMDPEQEGESGSPCRPPHIQDFRAKRLRLLNTAAVARARLRTETLLCRNARGAVTFMALWQEHDLGGGISGVRGGRTSRTPKYEGHCSRSRIAHFG